MAKFAFNTKNRLQFYVSDELGKKLRNISLDTFLNYTQILNKILVMEIDRFNYAEYSGMLDQVKDKATDRIRIHGFIRDDLFKKFMEIRRINKIPKSKLIRYFIIKTLKSNEIVL